MAITEILKNKNNQVGMQVEFVEGEDPRAIIRLNSCEITVRFDEKYRTDRPEQYAKLKGLDGFETFLLSMGMMVATQGNMRYFDALSSGVSALVVRTQELMREKGLWLA